MSTHIEDAVSVFAQRHGLSPSAARELSILIGDLVRSPRISPVTTIAEVTFERPIDPTVSDDGPTVRRSEPATEIAPPRDERLAQELGEPDAFHSTAPELGRYRYHGVIGVGGMGEVHRVLDPDLNRQMAMKVIRSGLSQHSESLARFVEEAQVCAQLQHPGIVPVHELGRLTDGRLYFTMQEVHGRSLSEVIAEVHGRAAERPPEEPSPSGWSFRRLLEVFRRVCEAVAYAHSRGVIHRDLKPDNVMLGSHGEVYVVDWGLAKVLGRPDPRYVDQRPIVTERSGVDSLATRMGAVAGTPAYMSPEQARGDLDQIDLRSDTYGLGAILYEILSGRRPYEGATPVAVMAKVVAGPPEPPGSTPPSEVSGLGRAYGEPGSAMAPSGRPIPRELLEICQRAMAREPDQRYHDASQLATAISQWLEGVRKRERALELVAKATEALGEADVLRERAADMRVEAEDRLAEIAVWESEQEKASLWARADQAEALDRLAGARSVEAEQLFQAALTHSPDLPEAHAALIERQRRVHRAAEERRDVPVADRAEVLLRTHAQALPGSHPVRQATFAYLRGDGALTLVTDPPGARAVLYRFERRSRRLVPVRERSLGRTPLRRTSLAMGSYLVALEAPGRSPVRYPVAIGRLEHWDGVPPGASEPEPIRLPPESALGPDDIYVPAGWFQCGGDPEAYDALPARRLWLDAFVVRRFPVTNREHIEFLNDLVAKGREEEAKRCAPRERGGTPGELGALIHGRDASGRFALRADADGDEWLADWPAMMVDWFGALAYARWLAEQTGQPWRLLGELEWEKAARSVDGRFYPWGDYLDPSWCCMRSSHAGRPLPVTVDRYPTDESVYGVRGLGGNVRDWCAEVFRPEGPPVADGRGASAAAPDAVDGSSRDNRVVRGGMWDGDARYARSANRHRSAPTYRTAGHGLRVARSIGGPTAGGGGF